MQRQDDSRHASPGSVTPSKTDNQMMQIDEEDAERDEEYYKHGNQIVLHEDKQYYPEAEQVYGKDVQNLVMEEDAQPLTQPILDFRPPPQIQAKEKSYETTYSLDYMRLLSQKADHVRNVAICGALHHGKTLLCDMIFQQTHLPDKTSARWDLNKDYKFTDNRRDEIDREISLKSSPLSVILEDTREKSYFFNFMDTPGHPSFSDEVTAAFRLCDGAVIVVDCIEGLTFYVERLITEAIKQNIQFVILLNKLDRLVLELKLPPSDAYYKIKHTLDDINGVI